MLHLPRVPVFPIAGEKSLLTTGGAALRIPAKEKQHPFIGQLAPEIQLMDHKGRMVSLHATIALGRPIVLYFFPLAGSPHCTKESCSFRDALGVSPIFNDLNVIVIGISQDLADRQKKFVDEHQLNFRVLHDRGRETMNAWGVGRTMLGLVDARCTFVIDHRGIVRAMAEGVWDYAGHLRFAESWLVRIEDDLAGRERFYLPLLEDGSGVEPTGNEGEVPIRVIYGDDSAALAGGVGVAPRYGAAPLITSRTHGPVSLGSGSGLDDREANVSKASSALKSSESKKSLREWFSPKTNSGGAVFDEPLQVEPSKSDIPPVPSISQRHRSPYASMERSASARDFSAGDSSSSFGHHGSSTADISICAHHSRTGSETASAAGPQSMANYILVKRENRFGPQRHSGTSNETSSDSSHVATQGSLGLGGDDSYEEGCDLMIPAGGTGLSPPPVPTSGRAYPASLEMPYYRLRTADGVSALPLKFL